MKKRLVCIVLAVMGLMLVACGSKDKGAEISESEVTEEAAEAAAEAVETPNEESTIIVVDDAPEEEIYESTWMANPWVDSDKAGVLEATGFDMVAPEGAANLAYSYMPSTGMAQLNYVMDKAMWVLRMQHTEELEDISGMYLDWNHTGETKIAGMDAMEYAYASEQKGDYIDDLDCTQVINWYDAQNKVTYSLVAMGQLNGMDTTVFAEDLYNLQSVAIN